MWLVKNVIPLVNLRDYQQLAQVVMATPVGTKAHLVWSVRLATTPQVGQEENLMVIILPLAKKAASIMAAQVVQRVTPSMCLRQRVLLVIRTATLVKVVAVEMAAEAAINLA